MWLSNGQRKDYPSIQGARDTEGAWIHGTRDITRVIRDGLYMGLGIHSFRICESGGGGGRVGDTGHWGYKNLRMHSGVWDTDHQRH